MQYAGSIERQLAGKKSDIPHAASLCNLRIAEDAPFRQLPRFDGICWTCKACIASGTTFDRFFRQGYQVAAQKSIGGDSSA